MTEQTYTTKDLGAGEQIVRELRDLPDDRARAERIATAIAAERARCAKVAEGFPRSVVQDYERPGKQPGTEIRLATGSDIAAAIRASGGAASATDTESR